MKRKFVWDRPPPKKWECVERTPAPTPSPTPPPSFSPQELECRSKGFTSVGLCIACTFLQIAASQCEFQDDVDISCLTLPGTIPSEIGLLTQVTRLYLFYNEFTGTIPSELGNMINLKYLYLDDNELTGTIPKELGKLDQPTRLDTQQQQLNRNDSKGAWKLDQPTEQVVALHERFIRNDPDGACKVEQP